MNLDEVFQQLAQANPCKRIGKSGINAVRIEAPHLYATLVWEDGKCTARLRRTIEQTATEEIETHAELKAVLNEFGVDYQAP